jgi:BirA family transcriptional regulator, biotin operon repressor / biotin---[acetyl-CoA-carboxylase] ligase
MLVLAKSGVEEGVWLRAERQTSGRGRQGRDWASPSGNFYGSTLVRLRPTDPPGATLALVVAVALAETVLVFWPGAGDRLRLKWPNDLMIDGEKLSGILLERTGDAVVIGVGVNLAHHPLLADRATTSLAAHGVAIAPEPFADTLAESAARWVSRWRGEGLGPVRTRWLTLAHRVGTALTARLPDGEAIDGLFGGLDGDGALQLRLADGTVRVIHAADVFLL